MHYVSCFCDAMPKRHKLLESMFNVFGGWDYKTERQPNGNKNTFGVGREVIRHSFS